jgi:L-ascorbate metabolism protein UlaG (beta-lactamase superfamily)
VLCTAVLLPAGNGYAQAAPEPGGTVALLKREMSEKEAAIWYLGQDGFAVKTKRHLLIFDPLSPGSENSYVLPESADSLSSGVVNPETIKDLDVVVFISAMGEDHYGTGVWPWRRYIKNVTYVFGWDPVINQDNHEYVYMRPREEKEINGIRVTTIQATTSGVGFLVKVDGLVLFHGGDHVMLEPALKQRFTREIDFLAGKTGECDIAFLDFQTGAGDRPPSIASGIWYVDEKLSPRAIIPMGAMNAAIPRWQRKGPPGTYEYLIKDLIKEAPSDAVRSKIGETGKRGNLFLYRDGKITTR